jgi:hypothetical protein
VEIISAKMERKKSLLLILKVTKITINGITMPNLMSLVGTGAGPGFNAQECTNKSLTTGPFDNTCEADEVSPKVEAGVVARLRCLQP